jgi:hypothetical protein
MARIRQGTDRLIIAGSKSDVALRNALDRVFLEGKENWRVVVETDTDRTVVSHGVAKAKAGKKCAIYVKVRAEADVDTPVAEAVDPEVR